jgi:hypothetical protein
MSYKEPDTDESTTYAAGSLSSFTSQDSAEQPYGTRDVQVGESIQSINMHTAVDIHSFEKCRILKKHCLMTTFLLQVTKVMMQEILSKKWCHYIDCGRCTEQRMESRQSSSPCPVVHTLTNWKHGSALPMTDPAAEEPIYMNTGQLGMNKTKHQNAVKSCFSLTYLH